MGWQGVSVLWLADGESAEDAILRATAGYLEIDDDGEPRLSPARAVAPPACRVDLVDRAVAALEQDGSLIREPDEGGRAVFVDEIGGAVEVGPEMATAWTGETGDEEQFPRLWHRLQVLAGLGPSVVWEADDDVVVDVELTAQEAEELYRW